MTKNRISGTIEYQGFNLEFKGTTDNPSSSSKFKTSMYKIIDTDSFPSLVWLKDELYRKNIDVINLVSKLDTYNVLDSLYNNSSKLSKILSNTDYIKFSSDKPYKEYGEYDINDLRKITSDLTSKIKDSKLEEYTKSILIELIYKLLRNIEDNRGFELLQRIKEILREVDNKAHKDVFDGVDKLEDVINNLKFTGKILGVYLQQEKTIILFLNNILDKPKGNEIFSVNELNNLIIYRTYAHEMFHMIHFNQSLEVTNEDYGNNVVIEGLAKYFEIYYSEKYLKTNAYNDLMDLRKYHSVISYPYVGACYFDRCSVTYNKIEFEDVLRNSFNNTYIHFGLHTLLQGTKELDKIIKRL